MSRRIDTGGDGKLGPAQKSEEYLGRLAKYIPAEIVGLFIAVSGMVPEGSPSRQNALWIIFIGSFILVPVYLFFATRDPDKGPLWLQILLASIAFPIWVFALGGPFAGLPWYEGWISSIVLVFVTVIFGIVKPKKGS